MDVDINLTDTVVDKSKDSEFITKDSSYLRGTLCCIWENRFGKQSRTYKIAHRLGITAENHHIMLTNNISQTTLKEKSYGFNTTMKQWMIATSNSDITTIHNLLKYHIDLLNSRDPLWGMTGLHWAIKNDNLTLVEYLCEQGADIYIRSHTGETPLYFARKFNRINILQYLMQFIKNSSIIDNNSCYMDVLAVGSNNTTTTTDCDTIICSSIRKQSSNRISLTKDSFGSDYNTTLDRISSKLDFDLSDIYASTIDDDIRSYHYTNNLSSLNQIDVSNRNYFLKFNPTFFSSNENLDNDKIVTIITAASSSSSYSSLKDYTKSKLHHLIHQYRHKFIKVFRKKESLHKKSTT